MAPSAQQPSVPVISGEGRLVSNVGNIGADPGNFTKFLDLYTDARGWIRKRPGIGPIVGALAGASLTAMHEYVATNPTTGAETRWLFRATATSIQYYNRGTGAWVTMSLPYSPTAGGTWVFENAPIGVTAWCFAVNGIDEMIVFDGANWTIAGADGPPSPMGYSLGGQYLNGSVDVTEGSFIVLGTGTNWIGAGITAVDAIFEHDGARYPISTIDSNTQLTLTEMFKGETRVSQPYRILYGPGSWNLPPRYAYAYENPFTGHTTNIRAAALATDNILELVEHDQVRREITLTNIVYSPSLFAQGYTKIRLFRTAKDANILQALDMTLNNSAAPGSTSFTETPTTFVDTFLTRFPAQVVKLAKPPAGFIAVKYHQGRMFALTRTRLYYSLHETDVIGELGVASLSWPTTQWISVNQPRGLVLLGADGGETTLIIQTANGDFAVVGYDQRVAPIGLVKLPTHGGESFQYGALGAEGRLVSLYSNAHIIDWPGNNEYGLDIQDKLDELRPSLISGARVHRFVSKSFDFLLVSGPKASGSTTNDVTYVFDARRVRWYEWTQGFTSFVTAKNPTTGAVELWGSTSGGESFLLLQSGVWTDRGANFTPSLRTSQLWPAGALDLADMKQIQAFTSNGALAWPGELLINGQAEGAGHAFTLEAPRHQDANLSGKVEWTPTIEPRTQTSVAQIVLTFPSTGTDLYIEQAAVLFDRATVST
jgi:hypothetical protein